MKGFLCLAGLLLCSTSSSAELSPKEQIDFPWYIPSGMEPRPSDPDQLMQAVQRAFDAGADGVLASREYNEMRMPSLQAFGKAVRSV